MVVFACQEDSFRKEYESKVLTCKESQLKMVVNGTKKMIDVFEVVLEDTIFFPEGGGQPSDHGFIDDKEVLQVNRRGLEAVHFVKSSVEVGQVVKQTIDWDRRLDHMQQHSGQHLITGIADSLFKFSTTSWWLGEDSSFIELDTPSMTPAQLDQLEKEVNMKILAANPVTVKVYEDGDPELGDAKTRGLPDDHKGSVRIVTIHGVESNMCCGTHVTNLGQLQMIKLLHAEKGKKGKTNLHFLAGTRVLKQLSKSLEREKQMTVLLKNAPSSHVDLVDKLQKALKITNKNLQSVLKESVISEVKQIKENGKKYFNIYKKEADVDFINIFISEVNDENIFLFLTVGETVKQLALSGKPEYVAHLGPLVCKILDGKGAAKGTRFSAKIADLSPKSLLKANSLIEEYLQLKN